MKRKMCRSATATRWTCFFSHFVHRLHRVCVFEQSVETWSTRFDPIFRGQEYPVECRPCHLSLPGNSWRDRIRRKTHFTIDCQFGGSYFVCRSTFYCAKTETRNSECSDKKVATKYTKAETDNVFFFFFVVFTSSNRRDDTTWSAASSTFYSKRFLSCAKDNNINRNKSRMK